MRHVVQRQMKLIIKAMEVRYKHVLVSRILTVQGFTIRKRTETCSLRVQRVQIQGTYGFYTP